MDKGDLTKDTTCYDTGKIYLDKIEFLAGKSNYYATNHAPLLARQHQVKYDFGYKIKDAIKTTKVYYDIFYKSSYGPAKKFSAALKYAILIARLSDSNDTNSKEILEILSKSEFGALKLDDALAYATHIWLRISQRLI